MRKLTDSIVYRDDHYHCAFPSIVCRPDGELIVAFRRAPDRRCFGAPTPTHCDPNSQLILVRSRDHGRTWSPPELLHAHPLGGSQDPCMVQLRDGTIVCASYLWMLLSKEAVGNCVRGARGVETIYGWTQLLIGGYLVRSSDGGRSWGDPIYPPQIPEHANYYPGQPVHALNRGAMVEANDGKLYWAVANDSAPNPGVSDLHLMTSADKGITWTYAGPIAKHKTVHINEASMIQTLKGDLVVFSRTTHFDDHGVIARSTDMGKTWAWQDMGFQGHPYQATHLPDGRVLLVYGYRHEPYGIRARVLDPECTNFADAPEHILRDDGGTADLGYAWSCVTAEGKALVVYYIQHSEEGPRYIGGTLLDVAG